MWTLEQTHATNVTRAFLQRESQWPADCTSSQETCASLRWLPQTSSCNPVILLQGLFLCAGIIVVFYDYFGAFKRPAEVVQFKSVSNLPFLFGVVIYSYEGVGMILPVEASMKRKEKFPLTLTFVMSIITVIYVSFGAVSAHLCCHHPPPPPRPPGRLRFPPCPGNPPANPPSRPLSPHKSPLSCRRYGLYLLWCCTGSFSFLSHVQATPCV